MDYDTEFPKLCFEPTAALKVPPLPVPFIDVGFTDDPETDLVDPLSTDAPLPLSISPLIRAELASGRRLTQGDDVKETLELTLRLESDVGAQFQFGCSVGIFPQNPTGEVYELLKCLGLEEKRDASIKIAAKCGAKKKLPLYIPKKSTPRILLESVLEIRSVMKKTFLRSLAEHASEPKEKRRLLELCSRECSSEYDKYFLQRGLTLSDVLSSMPSCVPPLPLLLEHLPRLMVSMTASNPRPYSFASSQYFYEHSKKCFKIVFNQVVTSSGRSGTCSSWLKNKFEKLDDFCEKFEKMELLGSGCNTFKNVPVTIPLYFRKPSYATPCLLRGAMLLIAHGTGIAPILALIDELRAGEEIMVYFGCRYRDRDEIYKQEMEDFLNRKLISSYRVCYSRDRLESDPKYVQDLLYADKEIICDLLVNKSAYVYVCGDATNMAKDVRSVLLKILEAVRGITTEEAEEKIHEMETSETLVMDVWR